MIDFRETFKSVYSQYRDRNGQTFTHVMTIDKPDSTHDVESLPMYVIRFNDGTEIEAWPEEVEVK